MSWPDLTASVVETVRDTFGRTVEYERRDGSTASPVGVFDADGVRVDLASGVAQESVAPRLGVRLADFSPAPEHGDVWRIDGVSYRVVEIRPDGNGWAELTGEAL